MGTAHARLRLPSQVLISLVSSRLFVRILNSVFIDDEEEFDLHSMLSKHVPQDGQKKVPVDDAASFKEIALHHVRGSKYLIILENSGDEGDIFRYES